MRYVISRHGEAIEVTLNEFNTYYEFANEDIRDFFFNMIKTQQNKTIKKSPTIIGRTPAKEEKEKYNMEFTFKYDNRKQRVDCLPKDVDNVMVNGTTVIVTLTDKRKGIAKCMGGDYFDVMNGFKNAYYNAHNDGVGKLKKVLEGCVESAKRKGYKQAILKNYDDINPVQKKTMFNDVKELDKALANLKHVADASRYCKY